MRSRLTHIFCFILFASIVILFSGCGDSSDSDNTSANLSSLTLSNGIMNPSFNSSTLNYTFMLVGESSVTLTPTAENDGATIRVNGTVVESGQPSSAITLNPGENTITVVVTAADGITTKTYTVTAGYVSQEAYAKASNSGEDDWFGYSVSLSGDTLAVGASNEDSSATGVGGNQADNSAPSSGAVYVFTRAGTTWTQQAYIKASNTEAGDGFGGSISLSGDTLAVGAYGEDGSSTGVNGNQADNNAFGSGAVYILW